MLEGIDALVFDIQDVGARFYTYITTLGYCLEAAGKKGIEFYVLDRPNPINGAEVDGPVLDPDLRSFIGYFPMPIRHGDDGGRTGGNVQRRKSPERQAARHQDARLAAHRLVR